MNIVRAEIPGLAALLVIAGVALLLGLGALWLARRHTAKEREAARHRSRGHHPARRSEAPGATDPQD